MRVKMKKTRQRLFWSLCLGSCQPITLAEGRGQRAEGRGQRAEGRGQRAEGVNSALRDLGIVLLDSKTVD